MTFASALDQGRDAFERRAWRAAYDGLAAADREHPLDLDDLERLSTAAYLIGGADEVDLLVRAHHEAIRLALPVRGARLAFWIGFGLMDRGEVAQGSGWLARASRLLEGVPESVEHGYIQLPTALQALDEGDYDGAFARFEAMAAIADRFHDADLVTLSRLGRGMALVRQAEVPRGMAYLDEAMVAVTADEVSPMVVGIIYCAVIETCQRLFDLRRAHEWTDALARWIASQPDLVPYRGACLLYRAQLMQLHGSWQDASAEARRAHEWLARPPADPATGSAAYQEGDLHRLRGEFKRAAESYRQASLFGHRPEPGVSLLRFAQGDLRGAATAIRRGLEETQDPLVRPRILEAFVEIMLAAGDHPAAAAAAAELAEIAVRFRAPLLAAMAEHTAGAILLAASDPAAALAPLRRALRGWHDVNAPYDAARTRVLIGLASRDVGDTDTAALEFDAAHDAFARLGARPDLARLDALSGRRTAPAGGPAGGLTARELEVLRLLATGKTNRAIAMDLVISEKTVARHVSNIFTKLGLSSRSAATAYAYEHELLVSAT